MTARRRIGFYVHHEGLGHLTRCMAIAAELAAPVTVLSSLDPEVIAAAAARPVDVVRLPTDVGERSRTLDPTAGGALHWAPLDPDVVGPRARTIVEWLTTADVAALVCDVSVEAALLARLCGVPPIVVREHGRRTDAAHTVAHRVAHAILAPFPAALESTETPSWLQAASFHAGFISRPIARPARDEARELLDLGDRPTLLVVVGAGHHSLDERTLGGIGDELDGWQVVLLGASGCATVPGGAIRNDGWVPDVADHLAAADVVIGTAGSNLVAEVAAAGRPLICVPEDRPFAEQQQRAERLAELGVAVMSDGWPPVGGWASAVNAALALGGDGLGRLARGATPAIAADWLCRSVLASDGAR